MSSAPSLEAPRIRSWGKRALVVACGLLVGGVVVWWCLGDRYPELPNNSGPLPAEPNDLKREFRLRVERDGEVDAIYRFDAHPGTWEPRPDKPEVGNDDFARITWDETARRVNVITKDGMVLSFSRTKLNSLKERNFLVSLKRTPSRGTPPSLESWQKWMRVSVGEPGAGPERLRFWSYNWESSMLELFIESMLPGDQSQTFSSECTKVPSSAKEWTTIVMHQHAPNLTLHYDSMELRLNMSHMVEESFGMDVEVKAVVE